MTQTANTTHGSRTEPSLGNCYGDENPDAWFPEIPQGRRSERSIVNLVAETRRAIVLCNSCPKQAECLDEGMKPKNLPYGIWGGKLAGIGTVQTKLEPKIKEKNGYAEKVSIAHENIPKYFFDKFLK